MPVKADHNLHCSTHSHLLDHECSNGHMATCRDFRVLACESPMLFCGGCRPPDKLSLAGSEVHSAIAAFKIPTILGGRVESGLTIINAPDFDKHGMEDRIAGQVEQFLTEYQHTLSGACCLVQGSKDTPENYKKAFKAVLKKLDQDIAERTVLCIMSGESSDADEEKLKDVWQSISDAGILYKNWFHFKWPLLLREAAATQARQDNSDYLTQFFHSLSRKSQQTGPSKQKESCSTSLGCSHDDRIARKTRRRITRERRGAEPSVVSMETLYYKTIY